MLSSVRVLWLSKMFLIILLSLEILRWEESYMPVAIKKILLWRADVENKPGTLARAIGPLAQGGADLKVLMGYRHPGAAGAATLEVYPILGKKSAAAAQAAGFRASSIPALLVEGDGNPALGCRSEEHTSELQSL